MKKNISLVVTGVVVSLLFGIAHVNASKTPVVNVKAEVILGHRIGPSGQEMLIYGE